MGIKATIVMPLATPSLKWKNVKRMGTEVLLFGNDFDEAKAECKRLAKVSLTSAEEVTGDTAILSYPMIHDPSC